MELSKEVDRPKMIPFDTLAYAKKLEARGVEVKHAEAHAEVLAEVLEDSFPTKQDTHLAINKLSYEMSLFRDDMNAKFSGVATEFVNIATQFSNITAEFIVVRNEMKLDSAALRNEIKVESTILRNEFVSLKWDIIKWVLGISLAQTGLVFSILKLSH